MILSSVDQRRTAKKEKSMRKDKIGKCEFKCAFDILSKPSGGCIFNTNMFCTSDVSKLDLSTFYCKLSGN